MSNGKRFKVQPSCRRPGKYSGNCEPACSFIEAKAHDPFWVPLPPRKLLTPEDTATLQQVAASNLQACDKAAARMAAIDSDS